MEKKKKQSAREREKLERFAEMKARMTEQGRECIECTISVLRANVMALVTAGPIALAAIILYVLIWGELDVVFTPAGGLLWLAALIVSIPVHEGLHGLGWHWFTDDGWSSIHFGMMWKYLTPYCHCARPLRAGAYTAGVLLPFAVLGLGVSAAGIALENPLVLVLGAFNILAAGGDTTIVWMLPKYKDCLIYDHPTECGFIAFR